VFFCENSGGCHLWSSEFFLGSPFPFFCFVLFNYYLEFSFLFHFSLSLLIIIDDYIFSLGGGKGFCVPDSLLALFGYLQGSRHLSLVGSLPIPRSVPHYLYICLSEICGCFFPLYQKTKTNSHTLRTRTLHVLLGKLGGREGKNNGFILSCLNFHLFHNCKLPLVPLLCNRFTVSFPPFWI